MNAVRQVGHLAHTTGDALHLPYADSSFDAAMVAYGWRNFDDLAQSLKELQRVLKPNGTLIILEFSGRRRCGRASSIVCSACLRR